MQNSLIKCDFSVIWLIKTCIRAPVLLNLLNCWEKTIRCSAQPCILSFSPTYLINSIIHEHSCKILYVMIPNFQTDRSWQTARPRSDCSFRSSEGAVLSRFILFAILSAFLDKLLYGKATLFKVLDEQIFQVSEFLWILWYAVLMTIEVEFKWAQTNMIATRLRKVELGW